jgi:hypothetical protein
LSLFWTPVRPRVKMVAALRARKVRLRLVHIYGCCSGLALTLLQGERSSGGRTIYGRARWIYVRRGHASTKRLSIVDQARGTREPSSCVTIMSDVCVVELHLGKLREEDPTFRAVVFSQFTRYLCDVLIANAH